MKYLLIFMLLFFSCKSSTEMDKKSQEIPIDLSNELLFKYDQFVREFYSVTDTLEHFDKIDFPGGRFFLKENHYLVEKYADSEELLEWSWFLVRKGKTFIFESSGVTLSEIGIEKKYIKGYSRIGRGFKKNTTKLWRYIDNKDSKLLDDKYRKGFQDLYCIQKEGKYLEGDYFFLEISLSLEK